VGGGVRTGRGGWGGWWRTERRLWVAKGGIGSAYSRRMGCMGIYIGMGIYSEGEYILHCNTNVVYPHGALPQESSCLKEEIKTYLPCSSLFWIECWKNLTT